MPSAPRSTAQRLVSLLRRVFPEHVWCEDSIDLLGGSPVVPEADTGVPPLYWCAVSRGPRPLWLLGTDGVYAVLRKGGLHGSLEKHRVIYVASAPRGTAKTLRTA